MERGAVLFEHSQWKSLQSSFLEVQSHEKYECVYVWAVTWEEIHKPTSQFLSLH